ncbi:MAG: phosphomannose isomerase mannose pyrophosphorylase [Gammaproteobacteria bacterium]|jgi:hypothetical protein|nr:phosphomannose isomerase mannose pyrophosphorylase [Gammaproteobacteria bacterium]
MLGIIKNKYNSLSNCIRNLIQSSKPLCRLEDIDIIKRKVVIHCRGISTVIKINLEEIMYDEVLISNLSPVQAAWIGYYYGIHYEEFKLHNNSEIYNNGPPFTDRGGKCSMVMLDRRGNLVYFDQTKNRNLVAIPLIILKTQSLLQKFSPLQACYIGFLSGLSVSKDQNNITTVSQNKLRLVTANQ